MEKISKSSLAEKLYMIILIISYLLSGIGLIKDGKYGAFSVITTGLVIGLGYVYTYNLYRFMRRDTYEKSKIHFTINYNKLNWFMLIYMLIMITYGIRTGDGAAETGNLTSSSIFASLWGPDSIFMLYYCLCRDDFKCFARINAIVYVLYKILLGWSGIVLLVAILELYFIFKQRNINIIKTVIITIAAYIAGGTVYAFLYPLKYSIRYGIPYNIANKLTIMEGITNLSNRLAHYLESTLFMSSNTDKVVSLYAHSGKLAEFRSLFRPIIPSAIMHNKIFSNIGSCIYNAQSGYTGINITDNVGILYYYKLLIKCDPVSFLLCTVMFIFLIFLLKKIYNWFQTKPGQFNIIYFWIFFNSYSICGTLENWITNSYIKIVFFIPLFFALGIIKINITHKNYLYKREKNYEGIANISPRTIK